MAATASAEPNALGSRDMWDEIEPAGADQFHEIDWKIMDWHPDNDPVNFSFDLIDQVFHDVDALLQEALA